jgi:hypothetical protein
MSTPVVSLTFLLFPLHHLPFPLRTLCIELLLRLLYAYFGLLKLRGEPSVCAILAVLAFRTKPTEIEWT